MFDDKGDYAAFYINLQDVFDRTHFISVSRDAGQWTLGTLYGNDCRKYAIYPSRAEACEAALRYASDLQDSPLPHWEAEQLCDLIQRTAGAQVELQQLKTTLNSTLEGYISTNRISPDTTHICNTTKAITLKPAPIADEPFLAQNLVIELVYGTHPSLNPLSNPQPEPQVVV